MSADRPARRTDLHDPLKSPTQKHEEPVLFFSVLSLFPTLDADP
jgi:hypothetical protein